jgi:mannosyl-3-phosphoglycerate phosphatase
MVSSKTRAEMEVIHSQLALSDPFVAENGGGIFFPPESSLNPPPGSFLDKGLWKWSLGIPYHQLTRALHDIIAELGWNARGFSQMDIQEISHLTGLGLENSRLAAMREYDEPFLILAPERPELGLLHASAAQRGLKVSVGGRFCHLQGQNDKGVAMQRLLAMYRRTHRGVLSIALGDSQNDFSMLEGADYPVLVRSEKNFGTLEMDNPRLVVTRKPGPAGWNTAIMDILGEEEGE